MAITISRSEVKRKCRIAASETTYDSDIDALIDEMQPSIEYTIADRYLNDTSNSNLQSVLKLGILEILSGEFLQQLSRETGASETFTVANISIGAAPDRGAALIAQGSARLQPFRKAIDGLSSEAGVASTTLEATRTFSTDEMRGW